MEVVAAMGDVRTGDVTEVVVLVVVVVEENRAVEMLAGGDAQGG